MQIDAAKIWIFVKKFGCFLGFQEKSCDESVLEVTLWLS